MQSDPSQVRKPEPDIHADNIAHLSYLQMLSASAYLHMLLTKHGASLC